MSTPPDLFRPLSGPVRTQRGVLELKRGDSIPDDILPEERERLGKLGAIGMPPGYDVVKPSLAAVDVFTTQRHYFDHVKPVAQAIDAPVQIGRGLLGLLSHEATDGVRIEPFPRVPRPSHPTALVMGPRDIRTAVHRGWERVAYLPHGIGQDYNRTLMAPQPGGRIPWDRVDLVLLPSEFAGKRFEPLCPDAEKLVIGQPKLDELAAMPPPTDRVAALSFRWGHKRAPESAGAFEHYRAELAAVRRQLEERGIELIGHSHPRIFAEAAPVYREAGIEPVRDFRDVVARASVYACDNSSTLFEFAALGRPVVVMNCPAYRRDVDHGGRFWRWADIGEQVAGPEQLAEAIERAFDSDPNRTRRHAVVDEVLPLTDGQAAMRAAEALISRFPVASDPAPAEIPPTPPEAPTEGEQDVFVASSTPEQVLAAADSPEKATALLEAELATFGESARPAVVDGLRAAVGVPPPP